MNDDELNGRRVHVWRGRDRKEDINSLAEAIVAAVEGLFNRDGAPVQRDPEGRMLPVNLATFHNLIDKHIAGVRIRMDGNGKGHREYFTYQFGPAWRFDASLSGPQSEPPSLEPNEKDLDEIYRHELVWRLPRVVK